MPIFQPGVVPLGGIASTFDVVRFDRSQSGANRFISMPNLRLLNYHIQDGLFMSGQFDYILDDTDHSSPFPYQIEELWPLDAVGPYVVQQDDELLVYEYVEGERILVFDGFASVPQVNMGAGLSATLTAAGVAIRLNDQPIQNAVYRDADGPTGTTATETDLPVWFNPTVKGKATANATPKGYDAHAGQPDASPVFLDEGLYTIAGTTPVVPEFWTLAGFVEYLVWTENHGEKFVKNPITPTGVTLTEYLVSAAPLPGAQTMDLTDPSTYVTSDIIIRSFDVTGKTLIEALTEQLNYYGFHLFFQLLEDPNDPGAPINQMVIFRVDGRDGNAPQELFYPVKGGSIEVDFPDINEIAMARDGIDAPNEYEAETGEIEYEVSVVLACGFTPAAGDVSAISSFDHSKMANATAADRKKYRYYIFDECGQGHWDFVGASFVTAIASLDEVFGKPKNGDRQYANRFRPGLHSIFNQDTSGKPRKAELAISRDYAGKAPAVWDRTGTWRSMGESGWKLLPRELGIEVTADNPETWAIPKSADGIVPGDTVRGVTSIASPGGANTRFYLRLTTIIKGDKGIEALASKRTASPTKYTVRRLIESRDHWKKQVAAKCSVYNTSGAELIVRDDTGKAKSHVEALRLRTEFPAVAGSIPVPWISHAIGVGDNISKISGIDLSFQANAGGPVGEGPRYPAIVGISYTCTNPQTTTYKLTDQRSEVNEDANHGYGRSR